MLTESTMKIYTVTYHFHLFDEDAFTNAMADLEICGVFGEEESYTDNSVEENLDILILHIDLLATFRGVKTIALCDVGVERVAK